MRFIKFRVPIIGKPLIFTVLILIITAYSLPVFAADFSFESKTYRITMRGHVVEIGTDYARVFWSSPESMSINPADEENLIPYFADLPVTKDTVITDSTGKTILLDQLVPGQAVAASIRYKAEREKELENYYKKYRIIECQKILLTGQTLRRRSETTIAELGQNAMLGFVLAVEDSAIDVYVEGGQVMSAGGTEFMARGRYYHQIEGSTKYLDVKGGKINKNSIKPFQRVLIKVKDHSYYDGSYGYGGSRIESLQVLEQGSKMLSPEDIYRFHRISATVLRKQKNNEGVWEYIVTPDKGRRELMFRREYAIVDVDYGFGISPAFNGIGLEPGNHVEFTYTGIDYSQSPGRLIECYNLAFVSDTASPHLAS